MDSDGNVHTTDKLQEFDMQETPKEKLELTDKHE